MRKCVLAILTFTPAASVAQQGLWEGPFDFGNASHVPIVAVHLVHVFDGTTGKVVAFTWDQASPDCPPDLTRLWTPPPPDSPGNPGLFETIPPRRAGACPGNWTHIVCCGHSALADGRIFTAGGNYSPQADLFDPTPPPALQRWNDPLTPPNMFQARWYPTCTTLPNKSVLVSAGWSSNPPVVWVTSRSCTTRSRTRGRAS